MISSLVLNKNNEVAFFYGEPLGFTPRWVSIDIELGELYIVGDEDEGEMRPHKLDKIDDRIYLRVHERKELLLVEVADNDIRKPIKTEKIPLMIPGQPWEVQRMEDLTNPKVPPQYQKKKR